MTSSSTSQKLITLVQARKAIPHVAQLLRVERVAQLTMALPRQHRRDLRAFQCDAQYPLHVCVCTGSRVPRFASQCPACMHALAYTHAFMCCATASACVRTHSLVCVPVCCAMLRSHTHAHITSPTRIGALTVIPSRAHPHIHSRTMYGATRPRTHSRISECSVTHTENYTHTPTQA
jgi:hypothetical protein